jgi:5'-nucleotidase
VKQAFLATVTLVTTIGVLGCGSSNKETAGGIPMNESVTEIASPAPVQAYQPPPASQAPQQPVYETTTQTPAPQPTGVAIGGGTYTVKRGDTLYKIANQRYGDGKQWQRIVSANPGLDPAKLRVGQTIMLP